MPYTLAVTELRQMLSDTPFNKKASNKKLIGAIDGENVDFVTYDKRLFADTVEVFVAGESAQFNLNDPIQGSITLKSPPDKNVKVTANYYFQFWIDAELKNFLNKGAESTGVFVDVIPDNAYLVILPGLKNAALHLAAAMANDSLVAYLVNRRHSEEFNIEQDGNDDNGFSQMINALNARSKMFWDRGTWLRDDYYKRQGRRNAPSFKQKVGTPRIYGPRR